MQANIIALDLDDTLLKDDLSISDYTVEVVQKAVKKGIYICLCSGRSENAILPYVRRLDIAGTEQGRYIIAHNGSAITDLHRREIIYSHFVDPDLLIQAYRAASKAGLLCQVYDASTIYVPKENKWTNVDIKLSGLKQQLVPDFENFLKKQHPKMVIPGDPAHLQAFQAELKKELGSRCLIFISKPYFLEILPKDSGKGEALLWLAAKLDIPPEKTMAFGDSMNDESMIRLAGKSIAMKNGLPEIQRLAAHITEHTNNNDGVARFIEQHVLI